ncbi:hypothetical protein GO986_08515 [Deinococcus sp. HMF7620]|uniref:Uncharacterized protein n=1 Tax=Deinococcus arboris TaxID=2682977 RepID=A0A7C9MQW3_9DEIO|nr:hypothetical protein [Deinococcus arboris]MVN86804.1 hypothetical protein [Deinococcus arboris]
MEGFDLAPVLNLVTKSGPAGIVLALFFGLAALVREVRGGKVSAGKEADLQAQVAQLRTELQDLRTAMTKLETELDTSLDLNHSMRYQRDQARVRVEYLEQTCNIEPRTVWPPELGGTGALP